MVELAEQHFATELQRLPAHLAAWLAGIHDGQPKVFRDSAAENLRVFFERFQTSVGELLVDRPRRNILKRGNVRGAV